MDSSNSSRSVGKAPELGAPYGQHLFLHDLWVEAGGKTHGPNVETGTMPVEKLYPFLESLINRTHPIFKEST